MTLDAAKWNGTGGELSSCVINTSIRPCIIIFGALSEQIYQFTFYPFLFYVLIYMLCFLCIVICMHSFHSAHIFKVYNSVIWPTHSIFNYGHIVTLYSYFVYNPLNSYVYIHWILDFKYIYIIVINLMVSMLAHGRRPAIWYHIPFIILNSLVDRISVDCLECSFPILLTLQCLMSSV